MGLKKVIRFYRALTMVHNTQNYWFFGLSLSSGLFFLIVCGGTLDTAATYWPIVPAPDDR
jgi:hypothetical protein